MSTDNDPVSTDNKISRRGLLTKAAMGVPLALTLAHKPAFGAVCSISGFQSVNPSGVQFTGSGCGGFSPGGWGQNGDKVDGQDGSRTHWLKAGFYPNPRAGHNDPALANYDGAGTLFYDAFPVGPVSTIQGVINQTDTMHDVLINHTGTLEWHAIVNLLNANFYAPNYRLTAVDVVGLYSAYTSGATTYITDANKTVVNLNTVESNGGLQKFFDQYH